MDVLSGYNTPAKTGLNLPEPAAGSVNLVPTCNVPA